MENDGRLFIRSHEEARTLGQQRPPACLTEVLQCLIRLQNDWQGSIQSHSDLLIYGTLAKLLDTDTRKEGNDNRELTSLC